MRAVSRAASKADKMVAARVLQWVAWKVALRAGMWAALTVAH